MSARPGARRGHLATRHRYGKRIGSEAGQRLVQRVLPRDSPRATAQLKYAHLLRILALANVIHIAEDMSGNGYFPGWIKINDEVAGVLAGALVTMRTRILARYPCNIAEACIFIVVTDFDGTPPV
jgi:hypothetical protein